MRFLNDNSILRHDCRKTPYGVKAGNLAALMKGQAKLYGYEAMNNDQVTFAADDVEAHEIVKTLMRKHSLIVNDNRYDVSIENFVSSKDHPGKNDVGNHLLGIRSLDNGLTFYGFIAGGDGYRSVFMVLYYDGENLRLYTPVLGNRININRQEPLASGKASDKYYASYGIDKDSQGFNWDAIKVDLLANIEVDYECWIDKQRGEE